LVDKVRWWSGIVMHHVAYRKGIGASRNASHNQEQSRMKVVEWGAHSKNMNTHAWGVLRGERKKRQAAVVDGGNISLGRFGRGLATGLAGKKI